MPFLSPNLKRPCIFLLTLLELWCHYGNKAGLPCWMLRSKCPCHPSSWWSPLSFHQLTARYLTDLWVSPYVFIVCCCKQTTLKLSDIKKKLMIDPPQIAFLIYIHISSLFEFPLLQCHARVVPYALGLGRNLSMSYSRVDLVLMKKIIKPWLARE